MPSIDAGLTRRRLIPGSESPLGIRFVGKVKNPVSDFWTNTLWWLTRLWERLSERPWFGQLQGSLSDAARWLWGSGTPIVGGLTVLLAGVIVARAIRESGQRKHPPQTDWVADRISRDSAGRWRPTMTLNHVRRADLPTEILRPMRLKPAKRA